MVGDLASIPNDSHVFVDTMILDYHLMGRSATCTAFVRRIERNDINGYTSTQVLCELMHQLMMQDAADTKLTAKRNFNELRKVFKANSAEASKLIQYPTWFQSINQLGFKILAITRKQIVECIQIQRHHGLLTADSLHVQAMRDWKIPLKHIASHDSDFDSVPMIVRWEPKDVT